MEEVTALGARRNRAPGPGSQHRVAPGGPGVAASGGDSARGGGITSGNRRPSATAFGVLGIAGAIALVSLIEFGGIKEGTFLALLVFILVGVIVPPIGFVVGLIVLLVLLYRGDAAQKILAWSQAVTTAPATTGPPAASIAPYLPGYAPPSAGPGAYAPLGPTVT